MKNMTILKIAYERFLAWRVRGLGISDDKYGPVSDFWLGFEGFASRSRRVSRRFVRGSRAISLEPSLHRASTVKTIAHTLGDIQRYIAIYNYDTLLLW